MAKLRLDKYLADMQLGTRSEVKEYIRKGRIQIDGQVVKQSDYKIDTVTQNAFFDGKEISYIETEYYMLNKPAGVLSATSDKKVQTVVDLIKTKNRKDLFPVGRLDKDTEGLLIITNDGEMAHNLLAPKKHVDKVYYAKVKGAISKKEIAQFSDGLQIHEDFKALPAKLELLSIQKPMEEQKDLTKRDDQKDFIVTDPYSEVLVTIQEGKFHQIKKMFLAVDSEVIYLKRLSMGKVKLDDQLAPGEYRKLTDQEIKDLQNP